MDIRNYCIKVKNMKIRFLTYYITLFFFFFLQYYNKDESSEPSKGSEL